MRLAQLIRYLYRDSETPWSGYLYRASREAGGHLYHTDPEGARYYTWNQPHNILRVYECPDISAACFCTDSGDDPPTPAVINGVVQISLLYLYQITGRDPDDGDDWVNVMDDALPILTKKYPAIVIDGETGDEVTGFPVEVALAESPKEASGPAAISTLMN